MCRELYYIPSVNMIHVSNRGRAVNRVSEADVDLSAPMEDYPSPHSSLYIKKKCAFTPLQTMKLATLPDTHTSNASASSELQYYCR